MKKLKLVFSDLHLGKGRLLEGGGINSLEEFHFGDKLVEFFHYYSSGAFKEYSIELIINGDFLNFLQVDYKGHFLTVLTEPICVEVLKSILQGHAKVFSAMREFVSNPQNSITYVVGNHDQAMLWPACREVFSQCVGHPVRFINLSYQFNGVHIEHGHMHEAANRFNTRRFFIKKDLPEQILNLPFGSHFFIDLVLKIKEKYPFVDKIRPFSAMIRWSLINETRMTIVTMFKALAYFVKSLNDPQNQKGWKFKDLVGIVLESAVFPDLTEAARKVLADPNIHTVIFGHNHVYTYRQWGHDKEYFNTGTWTDLTSLDINSLGKITKLTYVLIEYPENSDRPRGRLKEWRGYHRIEEDVAVS